MTITNTPTRIYLIYGIDDHECTEIDHNECVDVPWSNNREYPSDVEYIRADAVKDAHPKCGSCDYYGLNHPDGWNECINEHSPYMERHDGMIYKDVDYCRFHSELAK